MPSLTLYYDSHCPFCLKSMQRLARLDRHGRLGFIDMHTPGFDPSLLGASLQAMNRELHGMDENGRLLVGIDCIAAAYSAVGRGWLVLPLRLAVTKPLWSRLYCWFARNRYRASTLLGYECSDNACARRFD